MKTVKFVTKKKRVNIKGILLLVWLFSFFVYILSSVFIQSHNVATVSEIHKQEEEIKKLNESINILSLNVKELSTRERIVSIVKDQGLDSNPDNVVSINR